MPEVINQQDVCVECNQPLRWRGQIDCKTHAAFEAEHGVPLDEVSSSPVQSEPTIIVEDIDDNAKLEISHSEMNKTVLVRLSASFDSFELDPDTAIGLAELLIKKARLLGSKRPLQLIPE